MIITIVSPDKISLSMFCDFYQSIYLNGVKSDIVDLGCLFDKEYQQRMYEGYKKEFDDGVLLIKYKIKFNTKIEGLPEAVTKLSDHAIRFDLYSFEPLIMASVDQTYLLPILDRYRLNIKKLNVTS